MYQLKTIIFHYLLVSVLQKSMRSLVECLQLGLSQAIVKVSAEATVTSRLQQERIIFQAQITWFLAGFNFLQADR
jgi:hypothetical protein